MLRVFFESLINNIPRIFKILRGQNLFFLLRYSCPKITLGNRNASFTLNPVLISPGDTVYSIGIGTDISFDLQLIKNFGVTIYAFDPTPKSIEWLSEQRLPSNFKSFPVGLADFSGEADFYLPKNENFVSASMTTRQSEKLVKVTVKTLTDLMKEMGHTSVDLLKLDIEGAEYDVIDNFLMSGVRIHQLLVEFHHRFYPQGVNKTRNTIKKLRNAGFILFHVSKNGEEFSFINLEYSK